MKRESGPVERLGPVDVGRGGFGGSGVTYVQNSRRACVAYDNKRLLVVARNSAWASFDGGETWPVKRLVYAGPSAYSSLIAGRPGTPSQGWIYLQFEEREAGGRMARFNLSWLMGGKPTGDGQLPEALDH